LSAQDNFITIILLQPLHPHLDPHNNTFLLSKRARTHTYIWEIRYGTHGSFNAMFGKKPLEKDNEIDLILGVVMLSL